MSVEHEAWDEERTAEHAKLAERESNVSKKPLRSPRSRRLNSSFLGGYSGNMKKLEETQLSSEQIYKGKLLDVWRDEVRLPNGRTAVREYVRHPGAAVMVPRLPDGRIIFVNQFRYAMDRVMVELPAGKLDPGDGPEETARRELVEEIGYASGKLVCLGQIHPCIGYSDEVITVYLAEDLTPEVEDNDHDEFLEPFELGLPEALDWIRRGKITDVKTIIALYWAEKYLQGEWGY